MIVIALAACVILLAAALAIISFAFIAERRRAAGYADPARARRTPHPVAASEATPPAPPLATAGNARVTHVPTALTDGFARDSELRQLLGLLSHELRSPLGAIVGYQELLIDGLLGPLPDKALDAIRRMGTSGGQLRHLIDGLTDLLIPERDVTLDLEQVDGATAARVAAESARALAGGRSVQLEVVQGEALPRLVTDPTRLGAALDLAIGAAVRASPGATLRLTFGEDGGALLARVDGTALDPARDGPVGTSDAAADGAALAGQGIHTGAGLRLAMASRIAEILGGQVTIEGRAPASLQVRIPPAPIDASAPRS